MLTESCCQESTYTHTHRTEQKSFATILSKRNSEKERKEREERQTDRQTDRKTKFRTNIIEKESDFGLRTTFDFPASKGRRRRRSFLSFIFQ